MNSSLSPVILIGTILTGTLFFSPNASAAESADKVLFYKKPAQNWEQEALPIGNGWMGASLFGGVSHERILLNEKTLWEGGPGEWTGYGKPDPGKGCYEYDGQRSRPAESTTDRDGRRTQRSIKKSNGRIRTAVKYEKNVNGDVVSSSFYYVPIRVFALSLSNYFLLFP